ncbi:MAG: DUF1257 domain-containing protein [Planctomycetes bacterium]|nr:DUF1257 domain-containing protein [Planctomycetota bacterium]
MAKLRRIPTSMTSGAALVAALEQLGLREVERCPDPSPLISWRGQPLPELAEIIVRRRSIGATADDLGFVRGAEGRYEAIVSEILLSRFDKRWFAELEKRYAALAGPAAAPPEPRAAKAPERPAERATEFAPPKAPERSRAPAQSPPPAPSPLPRPSPRAETSAPPPLPRRGSIEVDSVEMPALAREDGNAADLAKIETDLVAILGAAKRAGGGYGCLRSLVLVALICVAATGARSVAILVLGLVGYGVFTVRDLARRHERMVQAATAEFRLRFGSRAKARELALQRLRREIGKLDGDKRAVVEQLLRRLS